MGALVSWPRSSRVIIPEQVINLFQIFLSRHLPALNSPGDQGHFWSRGGSKKFQTSYLPGLGIITRLDPGDETSAPSDSTLHVYASFHLIKRPCTSIPNTSLSYPLEESCSDWTGYLSSGGGFKLLTSMNGL
jgi:hypothetical protein